MIKRLTISLCAVALSSLTIAQTIVNTGAGPRKAILEEFTGVNCPNCPDGHEVIEDILIAYPNDEVFVISYNPSNSNFTSPTGGATDFRRDFLDSFYAGAYCSPVSGGRFMPSAFINRELWTDGERLQSRGAWEGYVDDVVASGNSPMNIGISSTYDSTTAMLTVDMEIYYHTDVTDDNSYYVFLGEHDLSSTSQSGSSANAANPYLYVNNIFRETMTTGTWGDPVTGPTTAGSLFTKQLTFDLSTAEDPMIMSNVDVIAFIIEDESTEIYTGIEVPADGGLGSTGFGNVGISEAGYSSVEFYPNPATDLITLTGIESNATISILNGMGQVVANVPNVGSVTSYALNQLSSGTYVIQVVGEDQISTSRLMKF
jgi:hypothetical protein